MTEQDWTTDVLGAPYEVRTLELPPDDEGPVVATLVRRRAARPAGEPAGRAVLYVHGWADYFFQTHLADWFVDRGVDFYAVDLRKYGRSVRAHQTPFDCRSIADYFPDLDAATAVIREEDGHDSLLLQAHSTGGLIAALWSHRRRGADLVQGLALNSPFLDIHVPIPEPARVLLADTVAWLGRRRPRTTVRMGTSDAYGRFLHADHGGEWTFDLGWKPLQGPGVTAGWLGAIRTAQRRVHTGLDIACPVLVQCSTASSVPGPGPGDDAVRWTDVVLDVDQIARWSVRLGRHVTLERIDGGVHDLVLSTPPVRREFFAGLGRWLTAYVP